MSWRKITEADLLTQISGAELDGFRKAALAKKQPDPVQPSIDLVTAKVRGYVAGKHAGALSANSSAVPERLIGAAVSMVIIEIQTRAAGILIDPKGARQKAADEAGRLLRDVAAGNFSITDPSTGQESSSSGASVMNSRKPRVTRNNLKGL